MTALVVVLLVLIALALVFILGAVHGQSTHEREIWHAALTQAQRTLETIVKLQVAELDTYRRQLRHAGVQQDEAQAERGRVHST